MSCVTLRLYSSLTRRFNTLRERKYYDSMVSQCVIHYITNKKVVHGILFLVIWIVFRIWSNIIYVKNFMSRITIYKVQH